MNPKNSMINMNTNNIILIILIIILISLSIFFYQNYQERVLQASQENKESQEFLKEKIRKLEYNMNSSQKEVEKYDNNFSNIGNADVIIPNLATNNLINKSPLL